MMINVIEYNSSLLSKGAGLSSNITQNSTLRFNIFELSDAMARTICSRHLNNFQYWIDFVTRLLELKLLVSPILRSSNIKLIEERVNFLRDFSRTTRIGELSQAIVHIYLRKNLSYIAITDFELFCSLNTITIPPNSSTPDFVAQTSSNVTSKNICIAESKGSLTRSTTSVKSLLVKAKQQCNQGANILNGVFNIVQELAFCSKLSVVGEAKDSVLHYVDPIAPLSDVKGNNTPFNLHYATWFYIIGDFTNVERLLGNEKIVFSYELFEKRNINEEDYWVLTKIPKTLNTIFCDKFDVSKFLDSLQLFKFWSVGIADKVIKLLEENRYDSFKEFEFINESEKSHEAFSDGTIIIKELENE
ncbi:hypothetical protein [uncultured Tenacibaculum sp.]|uniref:hypothetical protein n=1 Tax=uncultured Tenacibaculum sp. TaxID=174713 RepID=UPI00262112F5|nr:hypothetical protein [uncultured Tenacibaculum sp.]